MSASVDVSILKNFIVKTVGSEKMSYSKAQDFDIDADKFKEADVDESKFLDVDEIIENDDLYEQFATLFIEEQEAKANEEDEEKAKEEQNKVKGKNGAGV